VQKNLQVDYQSSPSLTAIGDIGVHRQLEYSRIFGQPTDNPDAEGYYIYDFGFCETCYRKYIFQPNIPIMSVPSPQSQKASETGSTQTKNKCSLKSYF
jgi:hypothetical protein